MSNSTYYEVWSSWRVILQRPSISMMSKAVFQPPGDQSGYATPMIRPVDDAVDILAIAFEDRLLIWPLIEPLRRGKSTRTSAILL
jgi:hypothetical protein